MATSGKTYRSPQDPLWKLRSRIVRYLRKHGSSRTSEVFGSTGNGTDRETWLDVVQDLEMCGEIRVTPGVYHGAKVLTAVERVELREPDPGPPVAETGPVEPVKKFTGTVDQILALVERHKDCRDQGCVCKQWKEAVDAKDK